MPEYKLVYFNLRGRAENIRMAFEQAGIEYKDVRLDRDEFINEYKQKTPFGQLPVLEIDGVPYAQSNAILRYVARETGLDGGSSVNTLKVDMILDTLEDLVKAMSPWFTEKDPQKKQELMEKLSQESGPKFFGKLEEIIESNNTGFSVGSSLTISDIALANVIDFLQGVIKDFDFKKYPSLVALKTKVHSQPKIKAWIEKRPTTPF